MNSLDSLWFLTISLLQFAFGRESKGTHCGLLQRFYGAGCVLIEGIERTPDSGEQQRLIVHEHLSLVRSEVDIHTLCVGSDVQHHHWVLVPVVRVVHLIHQSRHLYQSMQETCTIESKYTRFVR